MTSTKGQRIHAAVIAAATAAGGWWSYNVLAAVLHSPAYTGQTGGGVDPWAFAGAVAAATALLGGAADYAVSHARTLGRLILPSAEPEPENTRYKLPPRPVPGETFALVLGEDHGTKQGYSRRPRWYSLPALGLCTGAFVVGPPGTGKTAGVLRPALDQLFAHQAAEAGQKMAGLIMDYKASLVPPVREAAARNGRMDDLLLIGPAHGVRWNPLHAPELEPRVLAGRILAVLENMSGQSSKGDTAWIVDNASRVAEHAIGIVRTATGYVTLQDVHEFITGLSANLDNAAEDETPARAADAFLVPYDALFKSNGGDNIAYQHHRCYFVQEFAGIESRYRTIYINELQRVTQYFVDPKYTELYSPREAEINYPGAAEAIDRGLVTVLDATVDKYGSLATMLGIFLKLDFQRAAIGRPQRHRDDPAYNFTRPLLFLCDEYQEFATTGEQGDDSFYAVCRESKVISIVATQSRASLVRRLGEDRTKVLLASLRTKIFLALSDPSDAEWAAKVCGEDWGEIENTSINESVSGASLTAGGGFLGKDTTVSQNYSLNRQKVNRFEPAAFRDLPAFSAIVSGFDGAAALPPARIYLKPYFRPEGETYREFSQGFGK
ncbi:conserved membrane protein of unknown function [Acidithiobacillus ferrivorans]|uniref:TraD/TraG TraM recognition site domain-containing protein n=1 Tax=Acidithiobacillus ferrivorans TaxID=160808 RepID=A0A060UU97_9PROT|nr:TraM recognition domain-containing protein [Acidithiobacillus ferrivorans]CDQ11960.1 conserved membrane hypothetical protein [Acidithiobacillus ferrivorans]SMH65516.1 conserved membrane protein of unknown function [Acidithiobacillus ferrivorans]